MHLRKAYSSFPKFFKLDTAFLFTFLAILYPNSGLAQTYNCDGIISNKPCAQVSAEKSSRYAVSRESEDEQEVSKNASTESYQKKGLLSRLTQESFEAKRKFGVKFDLTLVKASCEKETTSLEECGRLINEAGDRLQQRINEAEELSLKKKELELRERELKEKATSENNATSVTVVNDHRSLKINNGPGESRILIKGEKGDVRIKVRDEDDEMYRRKRDEHHDSRERKHRSQRDDEDESLRYDRERRKVNSPASIDLKPSAAQFAR